MSRAERTAITNKQEQAKAKAMPKQMQNKNKSTQRHSNIELQRDGQNKHLRVVCGFARHIFEFVDSVCRGLYNCKVIFGN